MAEIPTPSLGETQPNRWAHLDAVNKDWTPDRRAIVDTLKGRRWFQQTAPELQLRLSTLPQTGKENHNGFLKDLAARPEEMGGIKVQRLEDLAAGNFALIPKFAVENDKGDKFTYEYVSWRYGPESGAKGIVFVKGKDSKYTHFILLKGDKFATGKKEWDSVGGFADLKTGDPADKQVHTMLDRVNTEIKEEIGIEDIKIANVYDLGKLIPDAGMSNNQPNLFAAEIDGSEAKKIQAGKTAPNPDVYELKAGAIVIPMEQLPEIIKNNNDAFFLAAISRSLSYGLIKFPDVNAEPIPYRSS